MLRRWFLMGRGAVLAAATLLTAVSAGAAQENGGYFKQLEAQGWYGNGGNGSNSYYRQPPRFRTYSYYRQPYVSPSEYYSSAVVDQRARIHLQVPLGARVWFDNEKTAQTSSSRDFITPPLPAGREYSYTVRVEWTENGDKRESTRRIGIHAGDRVSLDMSNPTLARTTPE